MLPINNEAKAKICQKDKKPWPENKKTKPKVKRGKSPPMAGTTREASKCSKPVKSQN